jgi:hypothetical protein
MSPREHLLSIARCAPDIYLGANKGKVMTIDQIKAQSPAVLARSVQDGAAEIERLNKRLRIVEDALDRALSALRARAAGWLANCILAEIKDAK